VRLDIRPARGLAIARPYTALTEIAYDRQGYTGILLFFVGGKLVTVTGHNLKPVVDSLLACRVCGTQASAICTRRAKTTTRAEHISGFSRPLSGARGWLGAKPASAVRPPWAGDAQNPRSKGAYRAEYTSDAGGLRD